MVPSEVTSYDPALCPSIKDDIYVCMICHELPRCPTNLPCGHAGHFLFLGFFSFFLGFYFKERNVIGCMKCLRTALAHNRKCPKCRKSIPRYFELEEQAFVRNIICSLEVKKKSPKPITKNYLIFLLMIGTMYIIYSGRTMQAICIRNRLETFRRTLSTSLSPCLNPMWSLSSAGFLFGFFFCFFPF